jgi:UPF0755 protein
MCIVFEAVSGDAALFSIAAIAVHEWRWYNARRYKVEFFMINRLFRAIFILVTIGALIVGGLTWLLEREVARPVDPNNSEVLEFSVDDGATVTQIAEDLQAQGFISQPLLFRWLAREQEVDSLKAGTYNLRKDMTMSEIIAMLRQPRTGQGGDEVEFEIIPGQRIEQVAQTMVDKGLAPSTEAFLEVARNAEPFKATHQRLQSIPPGQGLEGYLFPAKYRVFASSTIPEVIDRILTEGFDANYQKFETEVIAQTGDGRAPTIHEIVTMASIVQREAANNEEMAHLAYIFWNRLKPENEAEVLNRLQADPTLQYAIGNQENWWPQLNERLTREQIDTLDNPYNTYKNRGLPPGPISNPGLEALRAAARPGTQRPDGTPGEDDLYFVAQCGGGGHVFAATNTEFNQRVAEQQNCPASS